MLKTALIFGDRMVLQRGKEIPVWGTAAPGTAVTVTVQGKTAVGRTDERGCWKVMVGPLEVSPGETLTVAGGGETLTCTDVLVGEVWLAGGQSNMEFHMRYDADMAAEKESCLNGQIRFFDYPEVSYPGQIDQGDYGREYGFWRPCDPENLERFSAVGYYFAKELQQKLGVPVGIIGCNWGGSPACAWMDKAHLLAGGGKAFLDEYAAAVKDLDLAAYDAAFREDPMNWHTDLLADPIGDLMMFGCTPEEFAARLQELGVDPGAMENFVPMIGPKYERRPGGLFESMLTPLAPYGLRGFLYYQGETDGDTHPECYATVFPALIRNWRDLWGEELPFLFTQIAPLERWMQCVGEPYAQIRAAQQDAADTVPGTGMAVTGDVGMRWDIHPKKKQPVGLRLALQAENRVYGLDVLCEGPRLVEAVLCGDSLALGFDEAGDGLTLTRRLPDGTPAEPSRLGGLQAFAGDRELDTSAWLATAQGDTVTLRGPGVSEVTEVRLGETGWYAMNLVNSAGIPARPGRLPVPARALTGLVWTREPAAWEISRHRIEITTRPHTDLWQRTYYHFRNDNAPVLQMETEEKFFSLIVRTDFSRSHHRFDQCGVVLYLDGENWLKASVEYENEEFQHLGSVVTNHGYSDWATTAIPAGVKTMWYRLSRREDDYCIECSPDGRTFRQMRVCHLHQGGGAIRVGVYACSPEDSSFTAVFTHLCLTDCAWKAHDGQAPD